MGEVEKLRGFILTTYEFAGLGVSDESLAPIKADGPVTGFRMAARDCAECYEDFNSKKIEELDLLLLSKGLPTITQMYNKNYQKFLSLISKSKIKTDEQFRLLNSFVTEQNGKLASIEERNKAQQLMGTYESSK
jgi:hypothetical protein